MIQVVIIFNNKYLMYFKIIGYLSLKQLNEIKFHLDITSHLYNKYPPWQYRIDLESKILAILGNQKLDLQKHHSGKNSIKLFVTDPLKSSPIHKDGLLAQSCLNICIDSNPEDWIRWWNDQLDNIYSQEVIQNGERSSRNLQTGPVTEIINWVCEFRPRPGCVYLLNVDKYHSYYCAGPNQRKVIQIKFAGRPSMTDLDNLLIRDQLNFNCIPTN